MDVAADESYKPPPEFHEDARDPLVDISLTDSTELWLIQWPVNQPPDFDGQEVSLKLHRDGRLGSFEGSSGKSYEVVSFASQEPDATVFLSSASGSKIVGQISRRVSLVHYPEPGELEKSSSTHPSKVHQRSRGTSSSSTSLKYSSPILGVKQRSSLSGSRMSHGSRSLTYSGSKQRSSESEVGEGSEHAKQKRASERSPHDSEREGRSDVTSSGSLQHSRRGLKSKKKLKIEE